MKFLFWAIVVFFLLRWLLKPFLKVAVMYSAKKMVENMQKQQTQQPKPKYPEGSIHVDHVPSSKEAKNVSGNKDGDYVDFEEIK
ncbi:MAG: DUF4834 family protein [Cytophagales bacterium]|nr:DUF4834 family protein [Cytophaga sp.]